MKVVILAGGLGTRLSEETTQVPKPLVKIGEMPIIWHIMKYYSYFGHNEFIICCGYLGYQLKEFFSNYLLHRSDVTIDMRNNQLKFHENKAEPWVVTLVDTGESTLTGGRLKRVQYLLEDDPYFFMTYGDGLSDVNIDDQEQFHRDHGKQATVLAVNSPSRFGALKINSGLVSEFEEKPLDGNNKINGGFFILDPEVLDHVDDDATSWELTPMQKLVNESQLMGFQHDGFWQPMDTLREKNLLTKLWKDGSAPWKIWHDG